MGIMRLLTQNVLNYPELLESSRRSKERLLLRVSKKSLLLLGKSRDFGIKRRKKGEKEA